MPGFLYGRKRTEGKKANLTITFANTVVRNFPRLVPMENVPQVRRSVAYGRMLSMLDDQGYRFKDFVLDASRFGIPQLRKRLFWSDGWTMPVSATVSQTGLATRRLTKDLQ